MKFSGIQRTSLLDFPDRMATVLFTPNCNLRCPFCHNWRIVLNPEPPFLNERTVLQMLSERRECINAVVVTGGEPTLHTRIPRFLKKLSQGGFKIKLDTNGFYPSVLKECLHYVDYVALDLKTSPRKYEALGAKSTNRLMNTIGILMDGEVRHEFRTTVVPGFVDDDDIPRMGAVVKGGQRFVFQQFISGDTLSKTFNEVTPYSRDVISRYAEIMKDYVDDVVLRI